MSAPQRERSPVVDGALDGIVMINHTGEVLEFNRAAETIFGYSRDEAVGAQIAELIIPDFHRAPHEAGFNAYVSAGATAKMIGRRIETEARRKCGTVFPVELTIVEAPGAERRVFIGYLRDLTERRDMEAKMARQRAVISQNEKLGAMGTLLANVAHELNNPLSVVIGQAELMREQPLDPTVARQAGRILSAANRCAGIVRTLLAAVRRKPPVRHRFDAADPLLSSIDLVDAAFESAGVDLTADIEDGLPELSGDDGQLGQVLANLLTNAHQALAAVPPPRKVAARLHREPETQSVIYVIADNGPGVPAELCSRIFEPFFTTKEEGVGTGVGLAIAHNIAVAHGGSLTVGRDPDLGGALFELRLPVDPSPGRDVPPEEAVQAGLALRHVLVVDDNPDVAETIVDLLRLQGLNADIAHGAEAALAMLEAADYDFILSDLRMPDVDGREFLERAAARWPGIERRFGFVTGDSLNDAAARFISGTGLPVIEKPVTRDDLGKLIAEMTARAEK